MGEQRSAAELNLFPNSRGMGDSDRRTRCELNSQVNSNRFPNGSPLPRNGRLSIGELDVSSIAGSPLPRNGRTSIGELDELNSRAHSTESEGAKFYLLFQEGHGRTTRIETACSQNRFDLVTGDQRSNRVNSTETNYNI